MHDIDAAVSEGMPDWPEDGGGTTGFFSISASKVVSITPNEPFPGWVTFGFTDEEDPLSLNAQMFYVPESQFFVAYEKYLDSKSGG